MLNKISKKVLDRVPKECEHCESIRIEFWEEIQGKFVFRCIDCGTYYPIRVDSGYIPLDFPF